MKVRYHYDNNFTQKPEEYSDLLLYQLGEMLCDSGNVVDSHTHLNWFEFTFIFSGNGTIYTNNIPTKVSQGDVYVSLPREIHKIVSNDIEPLRFCFCAFNFTETSELFQRIDFPAGQMPALFSSAALLRLFSESAGRNQRTRGAFQLSSGIRTEDGDTENSAAHQPRQRRGVFPAENQQYGISLLQRHQLYRYPPHDDCEPDRSGGDIRIQLRLYLPLLQE